MRKHEMNEMLWMLTFCQVHEYALTENQWDSVNLVLCDRS